MRYRFYRVHKYVCFVLYEFERLAAKTDFSDIGQVENLKIQLSAVHDLMYGHADHENPTRKRFFCLKPIQNEGE